MQTLRMLGAIALSSADGPELDALLRQPKSVALLAYLAMPRPGTWHRRDLLLATFWPELAQPAARAALRSALHLLRRHLAAGTIRTRGDDEVSIDPTLLSTDVGGLLDDVDANDRESAMRRYAGDLLPGLYIADAPEFERWLESERERLRTIAFRAASALADAHETAGAMERAAAAAGRACELALDDEAAARRWIALLDRTGERTQALAAFDRLRSRVAADFGAEPSPETAALVDRIRRRPAPAPSATPSEQHEPVTEVERAALPVAARVAAPPPAPERSRWAIDLRLAALGLVLALTAAAVALTAGYRRDRTAVSPIAGGMTSAPRRLVLLPIEDGAQDSASAYVASGVGYGITRRLERVGDLSVRVASRAEASLATGHVNDPTATFGSTTLLRVAIDSAGDSLDVRAALVDSATRRGRDVLTRRLPRGELGDVESRVAVAVTGALHRVGVPFAVRRDDRPVDPEAYRLTILGYHQLITLGDDALALRSFVRATELDPLHARAWAGLASVWGVRTGANQVPFDEGYDLTANAATRALALDSTQGSALANLGGVTALKYRRLDAGMPLMRRAMMYEPSNPEVFIVASFVHRYAHRWDEARDLVRVARQLDPLTLRYPLSEAGVELCAGRPEAAERVLRGALDQNPASAEARESLVRALALQHRFDDALDVWRAGVGPTTAPELTAVLARARGRQGYFDAVHTEGGRRLRAYRRAVADRPVSTLQLLHRQFQAGDSASGFASLEQGARERAEWIYRLPCFASVDEFRDTPHYAALAARIGALPLR
jgi:DNA-binding SARP family transcriptional activator/Flp pilus assembly protein TadD